MTKNTNSYGKKQQQNTKGDGSYSKQQNKGRDIAANSHYTKPVRTEEKRVAATNSEKPLTETVVIDKEFKGPVIVGDWKVFVNHQNRIVCSPLNPDATNAKHRTFTNEPGTVYIKTGKDSSYVYFRTAAFQKFLEECGNPYIVNAVPNGEYHAISGATKDAIFNAAITCDGDVSSLTQPVAFEPIVGPTAANSKIGAPNKFFNVSNATIAVFDKVKFDPETQDYTVYRTIVTTRPLPTIENEIREMVENNNACIRRMVNKKA